MGKQSWVFSPQEQSTVATIQCADKIFEDIQSVIFDKDGTLANSEAFLKSLGQKRSRLIDARIPGVQEPLLMAFGLEGDRLNPSGLLAVGGRRDNEIAAAAYIAETGRDWVEALEIAQTAFEEADRYLPRKADHTPLFPEVLEMLKSLGNAGVKLGIISSDTLENVQDFVHKNLLGELIQVQWGEGAGLTKPNPAILSSTCEALGIPLHSTLMVGDADTDVIMAQRAGVAGCIGVSWGWTEAIALPQADVILKQPGQIQVIP
jgi:phosphoglycolate phosphatase